jgi:hypothetical protein
MLILARARVLRALVYYYSFLLGCKGVIGDGFAVRDGLLGDGGVFLGHYRFFKFRIFA